MANAAFTTPAADAADLEARLGTKRAFDEARQRLVCAMAERDDRAADHWCAVSLLVVDAWNACPSPPPGATHH